MTTDMPYGDVVFTPPEVASSASELIRQRSEEGAVGIPLYIDGIDDYFRQMRPGELVTIIGRPSNFKSGLAQYVARSAAESIKHNDAFDGDKNYVAYVTWEQAVEEMALATISNQSGESADRLAQGVVEDVVALEKAATWRSTLPMWLIGHSVMRRSRRPRLTIDDVIESVSFIEDEWEKRPILIVLDYLQRVRERKSFSSPRLHYSDVVDMAKDAALQYGCPVLLACQAKREVDYREIPIPNAGDGAETSNIEHTSDGIITVWMPKTSRQLGQPLPMGLPLSGNILVSERLLLLSVAKRKMGPAGKVFACRVYPEKNTVMRYE